MYNLFKLIKVFGISFILQLEQSNNSKFINLFGIFVIKLLLILKSIKLINVDGK